MGPATVLSTSPSVMILQLRIDDEEVFVDFFAEAGGAFFAFAFAPALLCFSTLTSSSLSLSCCIAMKQGDELWLRSRESCAITWSEAASALGVGYESPAQYMRRKLRLIPDKEPNEFMLAGQKYEDWVVHLYREYVGAENVRVECDAFRVDAADNRLGGSPDRLVTFCATGETVLLECKTCWAGSVREEIPISHKIQMFGLCHTYELSKAHYACWSASSGVCFGEVTFADDLWECVYPYLKTFADNWSNKVVPGRTKWQQKDYITEIFSDKVFVRELQLK